MNALLMSKHKEVKNERFLISTRQNNAIPIAIRNIPVLTKWYGRARTHAYTCTHAHTHTCTHAHTHANTHTNMQECTHKHTHFLVSMQCTENSGCFPQGKRAATMQQACARFTGLQGLYKPSSIVRAPLFPNVDCALLTCRGMFCFLGFRGPSVGHCGHRH